MNNTKRKFLAGVIAAVVCFTMVLTSFGALIGAAFGILSNEDLINAINNGSLSLGDGVNLSNLTLGNGTITDVAKDGYEAVAGSEVADKTADYNTYNAPYYSDSVAYPTQYISATNALYQTDNKDIEASAVHYFTENIKADYALIVSDMRNTVFVKNNSTLVWALDTAENIYNAGSVLTSSKFNNGTVNVFADGLFDGYDTVYGVCVSQVLLVVQAGSSLSILGRDFNNNGYIDDVPVEIDANGDGTKEWFYEKLVMSGTAAFQAFDSTGRESNINNSNTYVSNIPGHAYPLIRMVGEYNTTDSALTCQLIISGADLRNNFNNNRDAQVESTSNNGNGTKYTNSDDVDCGGGAIYLASASAHETGRTSTTCGMFKNVVITNTRFSHCGAVRGGAVMVGKNFYCPEGVLDFSYSDFTYCYTAYYAYGYSGYSRHATLSGDGGAVCFFQDDTTSDGNWYHKNPSRIYVKKVDFTGATFTYCYAMRAGGAIHLGGYYYNKNRDPLCYGINDWATAWNITDNGDAEISLGTRIDELLLDHCSFYGCGAGWQIANPPKDASGNVLTGASFILTNAENVAPISATNSIFTNMLTVLGITTVAVEADTSASTSALYTMTDNTDATNSSVPNAEIRWKQTYDGDNSNDNGGNWKTYVSGNTTYTANLSHRKWNGWFNLLDTRIYGGGINGGAINANCRIAKITISNSTFEYCAADNNGSAMYMDDCFACPDFTFNNCLFENNLCTVSNREGSSIGADTGTVRATGIAAANIKMNDCSFLYNCNMGQGALFLNVNNTYNYKANNSTADDTGYTQYYVDTPGTEVNDCLFFGNFAKNNGAAIYCSGIMDINSSTFAHNFTNAGQGGAIFFGTYSRGGIVVSATKAQMQLDPNVGEGKTYEGNTIICDNMVGGNSGTTSGGGGIAVIIGHSVSVGDRNKAEITSGSYKSYPYSFDFKLGGVLVFNNHANNAGGGILYRVTNTTDTTSPVNAWLYNKSIILDEGHIFGNDALEYGGGVAVRDEYSLKSAVSQASISGAEICNNNTGTVGGGIYLYVKNGNIDITGGHVLANQATTNGGGIMIENTTTVNVSGGQIGATQYKHPEVVLSETASTFAVPSGAAFADGGNNAGGAGGGIYVLNDILTDDSSFVNKNIALNMTGGLVEGNVAVGDGGGLYMARPSGNTTYGNITFTMSDPGTGSSDFGFVGNEAVNGGGIYISSGGAKSEALRYTASISGGSISENVSSSYGGGMFITGLALVELDGGSVSKNEAGNNGGGIYINANAEFNMTGGELSANATDTMGGGIYAYNAPVNIDGGNIASNTAATNGGGACIRGGATLTMNGGNIETNTATSGNGGGVYVEHTYLTPADGNKTLYAAIWNLATVSNNLTAAEEAKIRTNFNEYLVALGYDIDALDIHIDTITAADVASAGTAVNNARADGKDYKVIISTGTNVDSTGLQTLVEDEKQMSTEYDTDKRRVALVSPETTLSRILYNMLINGSSASTVANPATISSATITAGNISGNTALGGNGGGLCCDNGSAVNLNASSDNKTYPVIDGNSAKNGGGIAAINGGDITMQGGYVTNNNAIGTSTFTSKVTTYQQSTHNGGVGGGIYVANPSGNTKGVASFSIVNYDTINSGIYLNNAEFAADDLYANAVETMISVPSFGGMKIKDGAGNVTGWYEDYATGEANYTVGLNGNKKDRAEYPIERYDKSETDKVFEAWVDEADKNADQDESISSPTKYINGSNFVCVTLGAYVVYDGNLTITKDVTGTVDTEQVFVFRVRRTFDQYGNATSAGDVDLYVTINGEGSLTISSLPLGTYEVTELTEWSWRYTIQSSKVEVANASGTYAAATDKSGTTTDDTVGIDLAPANDTGDCNNPEITFVNELTKTPWLDGNSPKVVNTAGEATMMDKEVAYANFKREETLI